MEKNSKSKELKKTTVKIELQKVPKTAYSAKWA